MESNSAPRITLNPNEPYRFSLKQERHKKQLQYLSAFKYIYNVTCPIGEGGQATVYDATLQPMGGKKAAHEEYQLIRVALKVSVLPNDSRATDAELKDMIKNGKQEIKNVQAIIKNNLPNIIKFYAAEDNSADQTTEIYRSFTIMQIAATNLETIFTKSIFMRAELAYQACMGLMSLHALKIYHRDIKPENIMVVRRKGNQDHFDAKLADIGHSCQLNATIRDYGNLDITRFGTAAFLCPQIKRNKTKIIDFKAVDAYSFCFSLLQLLFGVRNSEQLRQRLNKKLEKCQDLVESDFNIIMPKLEKSKELLGCIFKGLKDDPERRMKDLSELLAILKTYKDYQEKKCRFSNDKYYDYIMCLANNPNIDDIDTLIYENDLMNGLNNSDSDQIFGISVMTAVVKVNFIKKNCVLKMFKATTVEERDKLWNFIQECKRLQELFDDRTVRIYDKPKVYQFPEADQITDKNQLSSGKCILGFVFMEVGKTALALHSKDRLVMLEKKVSPQAKDLERVELEELEKLRQEQSEINLYLRSLTLRNRLQLCYEIMMVIDYYHRKEISIGTISAKAIMLFLTGATYKPKIVRLERLHSQCSTHEKVKDIKDFYQLFFQPLILNVEVKPDKQEEYEEIEARIASINAQLLQLLSRLGNSPPNDNNYIDQLKTLFFPFKDNQPSTYGNTPLDECTRVFPNLKKKLKEVTDLQRVDSNEYEALFERDNSSSPANVNVYERKQMNEFQWRKVINAIFVINIIKTAKYVGILQYYEAAFNLQKGLAYIVSERFRYKCENIEYLKSINEIRTNELIGNFKDIINGVKYLHTREKISHMSILPRNFYIVGNNQLTIKLGGFELAMTEKTVHEMLFSREQYTEKDQQFFPPEYFINPYPSQARFASDIWMFGASLVSFTSGPDRLPTRVQIEEYFKKGGNKKSSYSNVQDDTPNGRYVKIMREYLLCFDYKNRQGPNFIDDFLKVAFNFRTIVGKGTLDLNRIQQNTDYLLNLSQIISRLHDTLEYYLISQKPHFCQYLLDLLKNTSSAITKPNEDPAYVKLIGMVQSIPQYFLSNVNAWLYMLIYLEIYCLKQCDGNCTRGLIESEVFGEIKRNLNHRLSKAGNLMARYHTYLEKFEPELTKQGRELEGWDILKIFKQRLLLMFLLFRMYVLETHCPYTEDKVQKPSSFTEDDILLLQGFHMTFTVEDYLRLYQQQKITKLTKYSELQTMSLDDLVGKLTNMQQQQLRALI